MNINECFGPTIQGEGRHAGQRATFIRLAGCNLSCSWCDTPYSWDWTRYDRAAEVHSVAVDDLVRFVDEISEPGRVVISGGEPLLQARELATLLPRLRDLGVPLDLETNGTRPLGPTARMWSTVTASPKLPSSGQDALHTPINSDLLAVADFKLVIGSAEDARAASLLIARLEITPSRVWLMPEGITAEAVNQNLPMVMDLALSLECNVSPRLHVSGWGDERGV